MVGTGWKTLPGNNLCVTALEENRNPAAVNATVGAVPSSAYIDLTPSRMGADNSVLFYMYSATDSASSVQIQLWIDIAAQGASSRKWVKVGTPTTLTSSVAGEGAFGRFDNVPSGLVAPQLVAVTGSAVELWEQHTE